MKRIITWLPDAFLALILLATVILGCLTSCAGPDRQRTEADRATFNWFAPITRQYLTADPTLDEAAKRTHLRGIEAWDERIRAYEALLAAPIASPVPPSGGGQ